MPPGYSCTTSTPSKSDASSSLLRDSSAAMISSRSDMSRMRDATHTYEYFVNPLHNAPISRDALDGLSRDYLGIT